MSYWENTNLDEEECEFLPLDNIGTPTTFFVKDWENVKEYTFRNAEGNKFTRNYLQTSEGLLALSSKRLGRQLKPFRDSDEKGKLVIQRWCEGSDTRSTTFKVELDPLVTSTKKPKTAPRKPNK